MSRIPPESTFPLSAEASLDVVDAARREEDIELPGARTQRIVYSCPVDHSGSAVYVKGWYRADTENTPILFVHDIGEHFGLYRETADLISQRGFNVYGFDLRGHGRSGRRSGHIHRFGLLVRDLLQVCAWVKNREHGNPPIIVGQGVGALITLEFYRHFSKHCAGVVLAAPSMALTHQPSWLLSKTIRILSESSPTFRLPRFMRPKITDAAMGNGASNDADASGLEFAKITARYANEVLSAIANGTALLKAFNGEALILCPEADTLCHYDPILRLVAGLDRRDSLQVEIVADAGHQLFSNESPGRHFAIDMLINWIETCKFKRQRH